MVEKTSLKIFARTSDDDFLRGFCPAGDDDLFDIEVVEGHEYAPCDIAVVYGCEKSREKDARRWLINEVHQRHAGQKIVLETGFFGRRHEFRRKQTLRERFFPSKGALLRSVHHSHRVGLDGAFGHDADFLNLNSPPDRWNRLQASLGLATAPYRTTGKHILIVLQLPGDASLFGVEVGDWMIEVVNDLRTFTDRPIKVRFHPSTPLRYAAALKARFRAKKLTYLPIAQRDIAIDLKDCWACVMFSSGSSIDALMHGVPPICLSPANLAYRICSTTLADIENPRMPEREQFFSDIAYAQWTPDEIGSGMVWPRFRAALLERRAKRATTSPTGS